MAVKLRLTRVGKTKQPQYRIVAADSRSPRDGRFIEIVDCVASNSESQGKRHARCSSDLLRVYLDCDECFGDFIRQEVNIVESVRGPAPSVTPSPRPRAASRRT